MEPKEKCCANCRSLKTISGHFTYAVPDMAEPYREYNDLGDMMLEAHPDYPGISRVFVEERKKCGWALEKDITIHNPDSSGKECDLYSEAEK